MSIIPQTAQQKKRHPVGVAVKAGPSARCRVGLVPKEMAGHTISATTSCTYGFSFCNKNM